MKPVVYQIPLDPRTKKNHMTIAGRGAKCPTCHRFLNLFVKQGKAYDTYAASARYYLTPRPPEPISQPVNISYRFYMKTRRRVDMTNLIQAIDDILVSCGIIEDDSSRIVAGHDGTRVLYDKDNPRTEILITPMEVT